MLAIVGNYAGIHDNPVFGTGSEVWAFGSKGPYLPRLDVLFQLHQPYAWEEVPAHAEWLRNAAVPVYMREKRAEFATSIHYPFEKIFRLTEHVRVNGEPLKYFTSSPAYALALAIQQQRPKIAIHGMELIDKEYEAQKDCIAFWLGFAAGRGMEIDINCMEDIFKRPLYGAQREP